MNARRRRPDLASAVGVHVIVLLSLQIFLLAVGVDCLLAGETRTAWVTASLSVVLAAAAAAFSRYLPRGAR